MNTTIEFPDDLTTYDHDDGPPSLGSYAKVHCAKMSQAFWVKVVGYPDSDGLIDAEFANNPMGMGDVFGKPLKIRAANVKETMTEFELGQAEPRP